MKKQSAGIIPYRFVKKELFFFIAHPGGPFYRKKDNGFWSIVKGEIEEGEEPLKAAIREFEEETGIEIKGKFQALTPVKQKSGKLVHAWAIEQEISMEKVKSNTFQMEWPPKSGIMAEFPELDKFEWFNAKTTIQKLIPAQTQMIYELLELLQVSISEP
ncbi:NUDIX domain-containing protein [Niastella populi]|uniref:NUDIX hydrolase n=1 Tax=Niastella populi TaxID=550983 RepID=A0A1V9FLY6_9BACT|nr:NUDIX domain-containing protein [Niastella populi]OQP59352.1 NUDIX hydrolase [Niastella populi]